MIRRQILKKSLIVLLSGLLAVSMAACTPKPRGSEDRQKLLNEMKGPDVDSIKGSLLKQVDEAVKLGDLKRAQAMMKQLVDKEPNDTALLLQYADLQRKNGQFDDAIKTFDVILTKDAGSLDAKEGKALALLAKGELTDSGNMFGEVLKVDPKRWRSLNAVGILFAMKNMQNEANSYFQEALKQSNNSVAVMNNIALSKAFNHDFDGAVAMLSEARAKLPEDSPEIRQISLNLALVYGIMGRMDDVQRVSEKYLSEEQLYNNLGFYAILAKDENLAKTYLNMALTQSPKYYERAWENLDMISSGSSPGSNGASGKLPQFKAK